MVIASLGPVIHKNMTIVDLQMTVLANSPRSG
jgi:hypothetical protein